MLYQKQKVFQPLIVKLQADIKAICWSLIADSTCFPPVGGSINQRFWMGCQRKLGKEVDKQ